MRKRKEIIENKIYAAIIGECEGMEASRNYIGNGHHLAQRLTRMVSEGLLSKQQKKIFDCLNGVPQRAKEIAEKSKLSSKQVSAQLKQIDETTLLISFKMKGRYKLWYKNN